MARNYLRMIKLAACVVWCLSVGCSRTAVPEPVKTPTIGPASLVRQKAGEIAALVSKQDIPQEFLLRLTEAGSEVKLDVLDTPVDHPGATFPEDMPVIASFAIIERSVSLSRGADDLKISNPLSPRVVQGFFNWYLSETRHVPREDRVTTLNRDDHVSFTVYRVPMMPDGYLYGTIKSDGTVLGVHPGGG